MSVLYLTEQNALVRLEAETLVIKIPEDKVVGREARKVRIPLMKVSQVVVFGNVTITTPAITAFAERQIELCYLSAHGKFIARTYGHDHKHSQLRLIQRRAHDDPEAAMKIASVCVSAKIQNQKTLLLRSNRTRNSEQIDTAIATIDAARVVIDSLPPGVAPQNPQRPQENTPLGSLTGLEGAAAAAYFGVFGNLIAEEWRFIGRHKRPPPDPVNALLSFGYTLLTSQCVAAAHIVGFDPYIGFMHTSQYGRPALALDILEMFRAPIVDSVVLTLLNNHMLTPDDFVETFGSWKLTDPARKLFLSKFEERLNTEITHPVFKTKVTYRRCLELQMRLLSRYLLGELKRFREFCVR